MHVDLDCFYAQVEMIRNPELRDKPLGTSYFAVNLEIMCIQAEETKVTNKLRMCLCGEIQAGTAEL